MQNGEYPCLECKAQGVNRVYHYPTALGTHRRAAHGIAGKTNKYYVKAKAVKQEAKSITTTGPVLPVATLGEIVEKNVEKKRGRPKGSHNPVNCFYCERVFGRVNARTKHIHEDHPGLDAHKQSTVLNAQKGNHESEEDKATREYAIRCAGFLEGLCHGMAAEKNYPPEEFTAGVARYLHAFTLR